jgi:hypothetical protein
MIQSPDVVKVLDLADADEGMTSRKNDMTSD